MPFTPIAELREARASGTAGARLDRLRVAGAAVRERLLAGARAKAFWTFDLAAFPYPTRFGLWGCAGGVAGLAPYVMLTHRMNVVRFVDAGGTDRILLMNPTDIDAARTTPFFENLLKKYGRTIGENLLSKRYARAEEHLRAAGIDPGQVDFLVFDHLHVQDLRPLLGTVRDPRGLYPRAKLLVQRAEWDSIPQLHPIQRHWYVPGGCDGIAPDRLEILDGDVDLGGGLCLLFTPGHTVGNHTLAAHTEGGIFCVAENGVSADSYSPQKSRIGGLARHSRYYGHEVILNSNTVQGAEDQYTSMVLEKTIAGPSPKNPDFYNVLPSSELTPWLLAPGTAPSFSHGAVRFGAL